MLFYLINNISDKIEKNHIKMSGNFVFSIWFEDVHCTRPGATHKKSTQSYLH